jgi:hypothetical protein
VCSQCRKYEPTISKVCVLAMQPSLAHLQSAEPQATSCSGLLSCRLLSTS